MTMLCVALGKDMFDILIPANDFTERFTGEIIPEQLQQKYSKVHLKLNNHLYVEDLALYFP